MRRGGDRTSSALLRARGLRVRAAALPGADRAEDQRARPGCAVGRLAVAGGVHDAAASPGSSDGQTGKREFVQVLRLMEVFRADEVAAAVRDAIARGAIGFDAVKHLVLCRIERRPPRLDMTVYPYLPQAHVAMTSAKTYLSLLTGAAS